MTLIIPPSISGDHCRVYNSGALTIGTGAYTALTFNSERYDPNGMHDTGSNTSRITIPTTGYYSIGGNLAFAANAVGQRSIGIKVDGATFIGVQYGTPLSGAQWFFSIATAYYLTAGQYVEMHVYQNSGGDLATVAQSNWGMEFWCHRDG